MTSNAFEGLLYRSQRAMLDAIVSHWLTGDGFNKESEIQEILSETTDEQLAAEAIEGWGLDQKPDHYDTSIPSHMDEEEYTAADLAEAFARFRAAFRPGDRDAA